MTSPNAFFRFFKILVLSVVRGEGVKRAKMAQNNKKNSVSLRISRTVHQMTVVFGTHVENDNISGNFFHFFKSLIFQAIQSSPINAKSKF